MDSIKLGNRRLLVLADYLDKIPRSRFDYNNWVGSDWEGKSDLSCGTTACALGHATTMKQFQRLGLKLEAYVDNEWNPETGTWDHKLSGGFVNTEVAKEIFCVAYEDFQHLFIPDESEYNATPKFVASKIRKFVQSRS